MRLKYQLIEAKDKILILSMKLQRFSTIMDQKVDIGENFVEK
jgi:hypothetical protein